MNTLLVFFAIPLATIILSAILETFINSPLKVAGIFFSIFIVVAFALGGTAELILAAVIYTVISFITALIVHFITHNNICGNNIIETTSQRNCYLDDYTNINTSANYADNSITTDTAISDTTNTVTNNLSRCRRYR